MPMNSQESTLITELFDRIAKNPPQQVDVEAERLIAEKVAANPHATYVLTQSTIILQQAVTAAQSRIAALEKQVAEASSTQQGGGFLSGVANLFGSSQTPAQPVPARPVAPPPIPQQAAPATTSGGSSFLQNAAATAAGVAGGALLFQGIENLMGHGGGFGGGGFGGGAGFMGQSQPTEVINNYYMDDQKNDAVAQTDDDTSYDLADNDNTFGGEDSDFLGGGDDLA
jgi:uncharacterized protein